MKTNHKESTCPQINAAAHSFSSGLAINQGPMPIPFGPNFHFTNP